jgi:Ribbon-helix-helix protein, copG family
MTNKKQDTVVGTSRGKPITEADIERMAAEAEAGYDLSKLRPRGGRPSMGSGPAEVVPVRLDPELRAAVEARASADDTTTSEIIREALRRYLHVA